MASGDVDAQIAHVLAGISLVVTTAYFSNSSVWWTTGLSVGLILYAAVKEFWYDANYEIPHQTWEDNLLDFGMYCAGIGLGWGFILLKLKLT